MKEIIAKKRKKTYAIMLIISLVSAIISIVYMQLIPSMQQTYRLSALFWGILSIPLAIIVADTRPIIEKNADTLVIMRGIMKTEINLSDIIDVFPTPHPNKSGTLQKNSISIKILENKKEQIIVCGDILDVDEAIKKLSEIRQ